MNILDIKIFAETLEPLALEQINALGEVYSDSKIRIMPDAHAGAGCTIGTTMTIHDRITPGAVGVDVSCLDCDTEVLTPEGWIRISEYAGQEIMQFSPQEDSGKFAKPLAYVRGECKEFYHFKNSKGLDQMVSEEHRMLVYRGHKDKIVPYIEHPRQFLDRDEDNLLKGYYRFKTCYKVEGGGVDISDELIRVCIMVQADGRIRKYPDYNFVELHFKKERKINRACELLSEAQIEYKIMKHPNGSTSITFHAPIFVDKDLTRFYRASYDQLKVISEECVLWDGCVLSHVYYSSTDKRSADLIQYAFIATNTRASIFCNDFNARRNPNHKNNWVVIPTKNPYVGYTVRPQLVPSKDGYKYCFVTDTGYFLCRRNNYTFLTGNCGMLVANIGGGLWGDSPSIHMERAICSVLDDVIRGGIPAGCNVREAPVCCFPKLDELRCPINKDNALRSIGTLGGGNHFIELDRSPSGEYFIVIHSGSRHLGLEVCNYYQDLAVKRLTDMSDKKRELIDGLKAEGRAKDIQTELSKIPIPKIDRDLAYLEGEDMENYLHDMRILQEYAQTNRATMLKVILDGMHWHAYEVFHTIHNYIDLDNMILRKGAVSARIGEKLIIPMNMRDGSLICYGKGNKDWNYSAPHGAGRLMSRAKAREILSMEQFKDSMKDVYSTSVCKETIDEAPMAYKPMEEIIRLIEPTVEIATIITPVYNFKATQ